MGVVLLVLLAAALSGQGIKNMHYYLQMKTSKWFYIRYKFVHLHGETLTDLRMPFTDLLLIFSIFNNKNSFENRYFTFFSYKLPFQVIYSVFLIILISRIKAIKNCFG